MIHGRVVFDDDNGMYVRPTQDFKGAGTRPFNPLMTDDIEGARAGKEADVTVGGIPMEKRRFWGVTNMVADVPGSQVGSKAPGLTTVRMTDPNERDYVLLDGRRWNAEELTVGKSWCECAETGGVRSAPAHPRAHAHMRRAAPRHVMPRHATPRHSRSAPYPALARRLLPPAQTTRPRPSWRRRRATRRRR